MNKIKPGADWTHLCEAVPGYWKPTPIRIVDAGECPYCHKTEKEARRADRKRAEES